MYKPTTSCGEVGLILHEIYQGVFGYKTDGTFVEVGAHDGKVGSFTYNLACLGWTGIYCEPVSSLYTLCKTNHQKHSAVKVLNCAIGDKPGSASITELDTLSTMDPDTCGLYDSIGWTQRSAEKRTNTVIVLPLDTVLTKFDIQPGFDLLVIDVEGYEEKVLQGFSLGKYKPKMIVIEIPDQHPEFVHNDVVMEKFGRVRKLLSDYTLIVNDVVDNVYVRKDLAHIFDFTQKVRFPQYSQ